MGTCTRTRATELRDRLQVDANIRWWDSLTAEQQRAWIAQHSPEEWAEQVRVDFWEFDPFWDQR